MNDFIISNQTELDRKIENIKKAGVDKLQVVSDFDKTLTKCFSGEKKIVSLISILRDENYLTPDYSEKAKALYNKYHPFENDNSLTDARRDELMREWWTTHYRVLAESGLSKGDIGNVINSHKIKFRVGVEMFLVELSKENIPLVILSATGLGTDAIKMYLEKEHKYFSNINIASNVFMWGKDGVFKGIEEHVVHSANKNYSVVKSFPFYANLKNKNNVILLGDSIDDSYMCEHHEFENIVKIGFLNEEIDKNKEVYSENYDVVILNDGSFEYINNLLLEILEK